MGMSEKALEIRRCKALRKNGKPCEAFACWGDTRCTRHGGIKRGKPVCKCPAYNWPHRPGGGLCEWPDPPRYRSTIPAGTPAEYKVPRMFRRIAVRGGDLTVSGYE